MPDLQAQLARSKNCDDPQQGDKGTSTGLNIAPGSDDDGWTVPHPVHLQDGTRVQLYKDGEALHAATVRALNEAAVRRISAYARLPTEERLAALVRATGFAQDDLQSALYYSGRRRANELRSAIALLEAARRRILLGNTRSSHGN